MSNITGSKEVAVAIRIEFKTLYPNIKFTIKTSLDSVKVKYNDASVSVKEIEKICNKYEFGSFDISDDCYKCDNKNNSIPQCRFVTVENL